MNMLWLVISVLLVIVVLIILNQVPSGKPAVAHEKIKQGATVIDVRTPSEYSAGHYSGSRNIPVQELHNRLTEVGDKSKPVVVYCASGTRSAQAAKILRAVGFTDVRDAGTLRNLDR